ncbi:MAG: hypothetical protein WB609_01345 [Candidatus Cybelea sp.]
MAVVFVTMVCAAVSAPFIALAWAMKRSSCPHCGGPIEPDRELMKTFMGQ